MSRFHSVLLGFRPALLTVSTLMLPSKMCVLSEEESGVFAWLVLAILLSKDQFDSVWGECIGGKANDPANLLLLLGGIKFSYDAAELKRGEKARYPLLRCDFNTAVHDGGLLTLGFEWLISFDQADYWGARRIDPQYHSNIPLKEHLTIIPSDRPTIIHYLNSDSASIANPSPLLLDAHNIMVSLYVMVSGGTTVIRPHFPLDGSIWTPFRRTLLFPPNFDSSTIKDDAMISAWLDGLD